MGQERFSYGVQKTPKQSGKHRPSKRVLARLWMVAVALTVIAVVADCTEGALLGRALLHEQVAISRITWCVYVLIAWLVAWWTLRDVLPFRRSGFTSLGVMAVTVILGWITQYMAINALTQWMTVAILQGSDKIFFVISLLCDLATANIFIITALITTIVFLVVRHGQQA